MCWCYEGVLEMCVIAIKFKCGSLNDSNWDQIKYCHLIHTETEEEEQSFSSSGKGTR